MGKIVVRVTGLGGVETFETEPVDSLTPEKITDAIEELTNLFYHGSKNGKLVKATGGIVINIQNVSSVKVEYVE